MICYLQVQQLLSTPCHLVNDRQYATYGFYMTIVLAVLFTYLQIIEYLTHHSIFLMVYTVLLFFCYRVSWIHVIIGTIFILVSFYRYLNFIYSSTHFGFEAASWYWHFVDVIWLFLFHNLHLGSCLNKKNFTGLLVKNWMQPIGWQMYLNTFVKHRVT